MKKLVLMMALLIGVAGVVCPGARGQDGQRKDRVQAVDGRAMGGQTITVCAYSAGSYTQVGTVWIYNGVVPCPSPVTLFADPAGVRPITPPLLTDSQGNFAYWLTPATYTECVTGPNVRGGCYAVQIGGTGGGGGSSIVTSVEVPLQISLGDLSISGCTNVTCTFDALAPLTSVPVAGSLIYNNGLHWVAQQGNNLFSPGIFQQSISGVPFYTDYDGLTDGSSYIKYTAALGPLPVLMNSNFELSLGLPVPGWNPNANATLSYERTTQAPGKSQSLKLVANGNAAGSVAFNNAFTPAIAGDTFFVSGMAKAGAGLTANVEIDFVDSNLNSIGIATANTSSASWTAVSAAGTAPAGTIYVIASVVSTPTSTAGPTWYDEIALYKTNLPGNNFLNADGSNAATTKVGASWSPGAANSYDLGSTPLPWRNVFIGVAASKSLGFTTSALTTNRLWAVQDVAGIPLVGTGSIGNGNCGQFVVAGGVTSIVDSGGPCSGPTGANAALGNLSAVAINTSLIPGAANTVALGTAPLPFKDLFLGVVANQSVHFSLSELTTNHTLTVPDTTGRIPPATGAWLDTDCPQATVVGGVIVGFRSVGGPCSGASGMNTAGSNAAATAVGASWIPGAANSWDLGTAPLPWRNAYFGAAANKAFNFVLTELTTNRTLTIPDTTGRIPPATGAWVDTECPQATVVGGVIVGFRSTGAVCGATTGANTALSNLSGVAINATLVPDLVNTRDLGTALLPWRNAFFGIAANKAISFNFAALTANRIITWPDKAGTPMLTTDALAPAQMPALTGNVTSSAGGVATTLATMPDGHPVLLTSPVSGQYFFFNGTNWVNVSPQQREDLQTGTIFTIPNTDGGLVVRQTNVGAITDTVPDGTATGFGTGFSFVIFNDNPPGGSQITANRTTSAQFDYLGTLVTSITLPPQTRAFFYCFDGTNWVVMVTNQAVVPTTFAANQFLGNITLSAAAAAATLISSTAVSPNWYATDTSAVTNTIVIAPNPALTGLPVGTIVTFTTPHAITAASTLTVNSLPTKALTKTGAIATALGDVLANAVYQAAYDGTGFELLNPSTASAGTGTVNTCGILHALGFFAATGTAISCLGEADASQYQYAADSGVANAYVITLAPPLVSLQVGDIVTFSTTHSSTDSSTINVSGLGVKNIFVFGIPFGSNTGTITAGTLYVIEWDGTEWQLLNPSQIPNFNLQHSIVTVNGQNCTLGSTCNVNTGAAGGTIAKNFGAGNAIAAASSHDMSLPFLCLDSSGSGTVQSCTTSPSNSPSPGDTIIYKTTTTNTGDLTINVNGGGAVHARKWQANSILAAGDLQAGVYQLATYDGTYWEFYTIGNPPTAGTVTSIATTSPITGGTITTSGTVACPTCVVASSPGAGVAHFAGSTQTATSSAVSLSADVTGQLPIGNVGSAGLSGTGCIAVASTGVISCATGVTSAASLTSTAIMTGAALQASQTPSATATLSSGGNMSLPGTLAVTGHLTFEGVTSTGAQGTGALVFATSPTLTTAVLGSSTATTQAAKDNSTKVATTAYVDASTPLTAGTSVTLSAPRQYFVCTGTCTITVPVPAAGNEFCVMNDDNVATVITMSAIGSSARYESTARTAYGTAGTGTFVSGGAAGDKVCLLGRDSTHYLTVSFVGTWTAN
jgi:hypothetical protein